MLVPIAARFLHLTSVTADALDLHQANVPYRVVTRADSRPKHASVRKRLDVSGRCVQGG
jgi:hypothetical protein